MEKYTLKVTLDAMDHANLVSYVTHVRKTNISTVIRDWIYRFAYPDNEIKESFYCQLDIDADLARYINNIVAAYNHRHGYDIGGDKFGDGVNKLLRRGIADMIAKGDRDP